MRRFLLGVLACFVVTCAPASAIAPRVAGPSGSGGDCTTASPCSLESAIQGAPGGTEVIVLPGTYGSAAHPLAQISASTTPLTIHGSEGGAHRPVVYVAAISVQSSGTPTTVTDMELIGSSASGVLQLGAASATRVIVRNPSGIACRLFGAATITNSVCASGAGTALQADANPAATVLGVTAVGSPGAFVSGGTASVANTIASGGLNSDGGAVVTADHNSTMPTFVDAASGDYREASASSTINAGNPAQSTGDYDVDDNLRTLGVSVDIGAFEFVPAPDFTGLDPTDVTSHSAVLHGSLMTNGGGTHWCASTTATLSNCLGADGVSVGSMAASGTDVTVDGLTANTTYHYHWVGVSDGGTGTTDELTFTTLPGPPTATAGDAAAVTATTATISGTVGLGGATAGKAHFVVGPTAEPEQAVTAGGLLTQALTGLAPNTSYAWLLHVTTSGGEVDSETKVFITLPETPTAVTGDVSNLTKTGAHLDGVADTKGVQGQVAILVDGTPTGEVTRFGGPFSVDVSGLTPGSTHSYQLRAITKGGTGLRALKSFKTTAAGASPTPTPSPGATKPKPTMKVAATRKQATVTLSCGSVACAAKVKGKIELNKLLGGLAHGTERLKAGETKTVTLKFGRKLRRKGKHTLTLKATFTYATGAPAMASYAVTYKKRSGGSTAGRF